ncbi:MAG: glycosyltransferase family protein [Cryomorphaceae bacterium]
MRVLYAIQGTGNGHIARAREIVPALKCQAQTDILISGMHAELSLDFEVDHRFNGLGFKFGKKGGVDYFSTWKEGSTLNFLREVRSLDLSGYDLVINDFEPVSAWAAKFQNIPCFGLSNQCALLDPSVPLPPPKKSDALALRVLKHYAPVDVCYGFHYQPVSPFVSTPVIRSEIRKLRVREGDEYMVYLPFYGDRQIVEVLRQFSDTRWTVFSKHAKEGKVIENVTVHPLDHDLFTRTLARCRGVISAAGFGLTSEVLFLGKKLMVIPMKGQYEQRCNAHALSQMGIPVVKSLKRKWHDAIREWVKRDVSMRIHYSDHTDQTVAGMLKDFRAIEGRELVERMASASRILE